MADRVSRIVYWQLTALAALNLPQALAAQVAGEAPSREVVQPLPRSETADLTEALRRIAANPQDVEALLNAGKASLKLEDANAAMGFFTRARDLGTGGAEARAGQAAALVYQKMPVEALKLFAEAEAQGFSALVFAPDHGLALDLVGDNVRAQTFYRMVLANGPDEEVTRRLALSQAIGGDQAASEMTLLPLLQRQDLAAYRARAFALAALGKTEEAVAIAEAIMPASLAARIAPYLRYMPKLTRAQQAAAAHFGHFPEASAIGRDDPRIAELARAAGGTRVVSSAADGRLVPVGEPFGPIIRPSPPPVETRIAVVENDEPPPAAAPATESPPAVTPFNPAPPGWIEEPAPPPGIAAAQEPSPGENANLPEPSFSISFAEANAGAEGGSGAIDLAALADNRSGTITPEEAAPEPANDAPPPPAASPPRPAGLSDAFAEFSAPTGTAGPAPGAVDVTAIEPAREPEKKPEPAKPVHPSRVWVQVATGRDRAALGFDWRRIVREGGAAMQGRSGHIVRWGQTNRLVTGPFDNRQRAQAFIADLKQAGIDSFIFTSAAGETVDPLPRR